MHLTIQEIKIFECVNLYKWVYCILNGSYNIFWALLIQYMGKTFVFLYPLILQAQSLFKRIYSTYPNHTHRIHSLLPSNKSNNRPILINKKSKKPSYLEKIITKKELRSYAERKLIRKSKNIAPKQLQLNAL